MDAESTMCLCCSQWAKQTALDAINVYSEVFMARLIPVFDNAEEEAKEAYHARLEAVEAAISFSVYEGDYHDERYVAESAENAAIQVRENLSFVKQQLMGLSIAGLYHLWERTLKQLIAKELDAYCDNKIDIEKLKKHDFKGIETLLKRYNHDIALEPYYGKLKELHLVTNVVKHGAGDSLNILVKAAPQLFGSSLNWLGKSLTADDLVLSLDDFKQYSGAVVEFWAQLPQRMTMLDSSEQA